MTHPYEKVTVSLGARSYDILIGAGLIAHAGEWIGPVLPSKRAIIVTDANVGPLYSEGLRASLRIHGIAAELLTVEAGEGAKSFAAYHALMERLLALSPDRKTTLIALGGGVIGDLTGFAASTLLRGVPFIQVPTTLLAQVDSAVGGKTAINSTQGKNLIGSFYQPLLVLSDTDTLRSLPPRELRAGYAEVIKYGLIADAAFYDWCIAHGASLLAGDSAAQRNAIRTACQMKAAIVGVDERESGARALLNFGHTFAHALEAETGYCDTLNHGEAVALGMVMACELSAQLGLIEADVGKHLAAHLAALGLPSSVQNIPHAWNAPAIAAHYGADKKAEAGALTFIVLEAIGKAAVRKNIAPELALRVTEHFTAVR